MTLVGNNCGYNVNAPVFIKMSPDNTSIWAAVYEKALTKIKGLSTNIVVAPEEALSYLTGLPLFLN